MNDMSEKAREVMELVETARIWYIDSGANIEFQLFGPVAGAILLAICKELAKKNLPSTRLYYFSGLYALATASHTTQRICE